MYTIIDEMYIFYLVSDFNKYCTSVSLFVFLWTHISISSARTGQDWGQLKKELELINSIRELEWKLELKELDQINLIGRF